MPENSQEFVEDTEELRVLSMKTEVIELLFRKFWPPEATMFVGPMIVTNDQVIESIKERNERHPGGRKLSEKNPANFLKDFIRKRTCNANWPQALKDLRITARQRYGEKQVFEFVKYSTGDDVPFPDRFDPPPGMRILPFEALSIPVEARVLGRADEAWLIQVVVSQRILHTHFAIVACEQGLVVETLAHLQTSVKTQPEIDATFVANIHSKRDQKLRAYVTCEAKQFNERILEYQIREQVAKAFELTSSLHGDDAIEAIVPTVFQVVNYPVTQDDGLVADKRGIYVVQFEMFDRETFDRAYKANMHEMPLLAQSRAFYDPHPPIRGISVNVRSRTNIGNEIKAAETPSLPSPIALPKQS